MRPGTVAAGSLQAPRYSCWAPYPVCCFVGAILHAGVPAGCNHRQWPLGAAGAWPAMPGTLSAASPPLRSFACLVIAACHKHEPQAGLWCLVPQAPRVHPVTVAATAGTVLSCWPSCLLACRHSPRSRPWHGLQALRCNSAAARHRFLARRVRLPCKADSACPEYEPRAALREPA